MAKHMRVKHYILAGLIPYTEPNLKLVFKPNLFFQDLAKLQKTNLHTTRNAYYRLIKQGYIVMIGDMPTLTEKGQHAAKQYHSKRLVGSKLMVVFDIPEIERGKRRKLRTLLRELSFQQIQQSVWVSEYDHREYLQAEIKHLNLPTEIKVYEAREIL